LHSGGSVLATLRSAAVLGVEALPVFVEVDVSFGLPVSRWSACRTPASAKAAIARTAIRNSGFELPGHRVVNLAPADVRKAGALRFADRARHPRRPGVVEPRRVDGVVLLGELADGSIQPIRGALPVAVAARREGRSAILLPRANAAEAFVVDGLRVLPVDSLNEAVDAFYSDLKDAPCAVRPIVASSEAEADLDFADVVGQGMAKRGLEIAAAGGHNVLLIGSPGGGKTMMARRVAGILPSLEFDEALDCTSVHSVAGTLPAGTALMQRRPFRAPHHTISEVAMAGGGTPLRPGEISLAHNGVLFLDELPRVRSPCSRGIEAALEEGRIAVARASRLSIFPARFMLLAAMNPCPCGFHGDRLRVCRCSPAQIERYRGRISGPLLDRIDLVIDVPAAGTTTRRPPEEPSSAIRDRVREARERQRVRFGAGRLNAQIDGAELRSHATLPEDAAALLEAAAHRFCLSARACSRVLRVSRTIADLTGAPRVEISHLAEAVQHAFLSLRQIFASRKIPVPRLDKLC
jgi:magnesium chelatase family protein